MEAVKQGAATVGLKSNTHAILVALKVQIPLIVFGVVASFLNVGCVPNTAAACPFLIGQVMYSLATNF